MNESVRKICLSLSAPCQSFTLACPLLAHLQKIQLWVISGRGLGGFHLTAQNRVLAIL